MYSQSSVKIVATKHTNILPSSYGHFSSQNILIMLHMFQVLYLLIYFSDNTIICKVNIILITNNSQLRELHSHKQLWTGGFQLRHWYLNLKINTCFGEKSSCFFYELKQNKTGQFFIKYFCNETVEKDILYKSCCRW